MPRLSLTRSHQEHLPGSRGATRRPIRFDTMSTNKSRATPPKTPATRPARSKAATPATRTARSAPAGPATATKTTETATAKTLTPPGGRIPIDNVMPVIDGGKYAAKSAVGEQLIVGATVYREGHDALGVNVVLTDSTGRTGPWTKMRLVAPGTDRYEAIVSADAPGAWTFHIEAWGDPLESWRHDARIKIPEGQDVELMLEEGARLHVQAAANLTGPSSTTDETGDAGRLLSVAETLRSAGDPVERLSAALARGVLALLARHPLRTLLTLSPALPVVGRS